MNKVFLAICVNASLVVFLCLRNKAEKLMGCEKGEKETRECFIPGGIAL